MSTIAWIDETIATIYPTMYPLEHDGHKILEIYSIHEARERLQEILAADVIICELRLSDGMRGSFPGLNFIDELHAGSNKVPPVVIFSTAANSVSARRYKELDIKDVIQKPVQPSALQAAIERIFNATPALSFG